MAAAFPVPMEAAAAFHETSPGDQTLPRRLRPNLSKFCRKTKMCSFFLRGVCKRGNTCTFAHDPVEIQAAPDLRCTKICPEIVRIGHCPKPETCKFAHHESELRRLYDDDEVSEATQPDTDPNADHSTVETLPCFQVMESAGTSEVSSGSGLSPHSIQKIPRSSVLASDKRRTSPAVVEKLNAAVAPGPMTRSEMTSYLASIFIAVYEARPEVEARVGLTAVFLASVTAEQAWKDESLSSDARLSFAALVRWSIKATTLGALFDSPETPVVTPKFAQDDDPVLSRASSKGDADVVSQGSSDMETTVGSRCTFGWQTPTNDFDVEDNLAALEVEVQNLFIRREASDASAAHTRSISGRQRRPR